MYTNLFTKEALEEMALEGQLIFPPTDLFVTLDDSSLKTSAGGDREDSYCIRSGFDASRYQLKRQEHADIYQFSEYIGGSFVPAYCLDKGVAGPPYGQP
jgi:hypothetical protein